ncbi:DUF4270 domain-containing protein [Terrimonas pollutisoli]|uniref:DUF4270 domain-containing protein n=1 Tax=Terrimonas pollutisoli TaxID=3034147 RepID=UPI0023ECC8F4|nr:DUF4270 domain-containing protein [Terrimonas sp. H1YJ31]
MKHKYLALTLGVIFTSIILLVSCKKINESTSLGGDLIPPVDNINTFDTTLEVQAFNDTFTVLTDTLRYSSAYTNFLGQINTDPFFGKTDAKIFLELKPPSYPYTFANKPDSLHIDSVVLVLNYVETYGDTLTPQTVNVYEIPQSSDFGDTSYTLRKSDYAKGTLLGSRTFDLRTLNDSVKAFEDTTANQLRIRLDDSFGQRLLNYDTIKGGLNGAYSTDTAFRTFFKGFALESVSGDAIMGFDLTGTNTKLAIYYRYDKNNVASADTTVAYFPFSGNTAGSASANFVKRDYAGTPLEASVGGTTPDDLVYIQNSPGSFATIKIPGLAGLNNRVVHRAELIMEQVYDAKDTIFPSPNLYVDAYDSSISAFRAIPYDISLDITGNSNLSSFGVSPFINSRDASGNSIRTWRFNLTRYVQHVVNDTEPVYDLRLFAPVYIDEQYRPGVAGSSGSLQRFPINDAAGKGRVRLGGGNHPTQKMKLRIVYSKI